jgi:hypothetical protein
LGKLVCGLKKGDEIKVFVRDFWSDKKLKCFCLEWDDKNSQTKFVFFQLWKF